MKKLITLLSICFMFHLNTMVAGADAVFIEPVKMRVTCYLPTGNPTASGVMPYVGCCAAKRDWIGGAAVLYTMEGEFVKILSIDDTGGHERIKNGTSIDVFVPDMETAKEWVATYAEENLYTGEKLY